MALNSENMPETYQEFYDRAFATDRQGIMDTGFLAEIVAATGAMFGCAICDTRVANCERVSEAIMDYYALTGDQQLDLEEDMRNCAPVFSPDGAHCTYHAERLAHEE